MYCKYWYNILLPGPHQPLVCSIIIMGRDEVILSTLIANHGIVLCRNDNIEAT